MFHKSWEIGEHTYWRAEPKGLQHQHLYSLNKRKKRRAYLQLIYLRSKSNLSSGICILAFYKKISILRLIIILLFYWCTISPHFVRVSWVIFSVCELQVYVKAKECSEKIPMEEFAIELAKHFTSFYTQVIMIGSNSLQPLHIQNIYISICLM